MILTDMQISEVCTVQVYTSDGSILPPDDYELTRIARDALPQGDWDFCEIKWDSSKTAVVWFERQD